MKPGVFSQVNRSVCPWRFAASTLRRLGVRYGRKPTFKLRHYPAPKSAPSRAPSTPCRPTLDRRPRLMATSRHRPIRPERYRCPPTTTDAKPAAHSARAARWPSSRGHSPAPPAATRRRASCSPPRRSAAMPACKPRPCRNSACTPAAAVVAPPPAVSRPRPCSLASPSPPPVRPGAVALPVRVGENPAHHQRHQRTRPALR